MSHISKVVSLGAALLVFVGGGQRRRSTRPDEADLTLPRPGSPSVCDAGPGPIDLADLGWEDWGHALQLRDLDG
jgi:hypothetical protein